MHASSCFTRFPQLFHPAIQQFALFKFCERRCLTHLVLYESLAYFDNSPVLELAGRFNKHVMDCHVQYSVGFSAFLSAVSSFTLLNNVVINKSSEDMGILPQVPHQLLNSVFSLCFELVYSVGFNYPNLRPPKFCYLQLNLFKRDLVWSSLDW